MWFCKESNPVAKRAYIQKIYEEYVTVRDANGNGVYQVPTHNMKGTIWSLGWHGTLHINGGDDHQNVFHADE